MSIRMRLIFIMTVGLSVAIVGGLRGAQAATGKGDYLPAHNFKVEIDGVIAGGFKGSVGASIEVEVLEETDTQGTTQRRAGRVKYKNITLKRGFVNDSSLLEWYKKVLAGTTDRKSGSVIYLDRAGNEVLRLTLTDCWPVRWELTASGKRRDQVQEEAEITCDNIQ